MQNDCSGWNDQPPKEDGDFFYNGKTPEGDEIVAIVQITTDPKGERWCSVFLPPFWRGDRERITAKVIFGELEKWRGQFSGPEHGLCCATA